MTNETIDSRVVHTPIDIVGEFASSFWRSGVEQPLEGILQLLGSNPEHVQLEDNLEGAMKQANMAGIAAGQIVDVAAATIVGMVAFKKLGLQSQLGSEMSSTLFTNGFAGAVYGGVLTPVEPGESQWTRLQHAVVDGGTFMTLGGATHALTGNLVTQATARGLAAATLKAGETYVPNILDRAAINTLAGAAAGIANVQLDANVHGQALATADQYVGGAFDWALGNLVGGEAFHQVGRVAKGIRALTTDSGASLPVVEKQDSILDLSDAYRAPILDANAVPAKQTYRFPLSQAPRRLYDIADAPLNEEVEKAAQFQAESESPWMRTLDGRKRFPTLVGELHADAVVVGSGIVGQRIADTLVGMGKRVMVVERGRVGMGTSNFMLGMNTPIPVSSFGISAHLLSRENFAEFGQRSMAARNETAKLGMQYGDFQSVNSYNIGYQGHLEDVAGEVRLGSKFYRNLDFIAGDEAANIFPSAQYVGIFRGDGNLNPRRLLVGMAGAGRYAVFEDSPVIGVSPARGGDGADVFTPSGIVHANKVIFATNGPVLPFEYVNDFLEPVQTFSQVADIKMNLPGNFFDTHTRPQTAALPNSWRQFGLPQFGPTETLVSGSARSLATRHDTAAPFEPKLNDVTQRLFGVAGRNQNTALIYNPGSVFQEGSGDGVPIYAIHHEFKGMSLATGTGTNGLIGSGLLAQAAAMEAVGKTDKLLSIDRRDDWLQLPESSDPD